MVKWLTIATAVLVAYLAYQKYQENKAKTV